MEAEPPLLKIEPVDEEEEDIEDETVAERIIALSEMFPQPVRNGVKMIYNQSVKGLGAAYRFTRSSLWVVGTSVVILGLPVIFEVERIQTEEAQLLQQRQILLGPGASGGAPGGAPPMGIPRR